ISCYPHVLLAVVATVFKSFSIRVNAGIKKFHLLTFTDYTDSRLIFISPRQIDSYEQHTFTPFSCSIVFMVPSDIIRMEIVESFLLPLSTIKIERTGK